MTIFFVMCLLLDIHKTCEAIFTYAAAIGFLVISLVLLAKFVWDHIKDWKRS